MGYRVPSAQSDFDQVALVSEPGLCASCLHGRRTGNTRGSVFWLCERSNRDPGYVRYPRLPVLACPGYELPERTSGRPVDDPEGRHLDCPPHQE